MSVLELRELGSDERRDVTLLDLFQRCREHVERVATGTGTGNFIATTTRKGFIQLIDLNSGEYRLFLTHLNGIPLDSSLRCFALVPPHLVRSQQDDTYLIFSLAYSNELVVANTRTGVVETLETCTTRPSVAFCDETSVACGEGCGRVVMWRACQPHDDEYTSRSQCLTALSLSRLWCSTLFDDAVACLRTCGSYLVAASADYRCVIASAEGGEVLATLAYEPDRVIAILPLTRYTFGAGLVLCTSRHLSIYGHPTPPTKISESTPSWVYLGGVTEMRTEGRCATSLGDIVACGTAAGMIVLYRCCNGGVNGVVEELVRFDVGYGVVGLQLYDTDELVVVTNAGDVWKWPVQDLLPCTSTSPERTIEPCEDGSEPLPDTTAPQPTLQVAASCANYSAAPSCASCDVVRQHACTQDNITRDISKNGSSGQPPLISAASSRASTDDDLGEEEVVLMTDAEEEESRVVVAAHGSIGKQNKLLSTHTVVKEGGDDGCSTQDDKRSTSDTQFDRDDPSGVATQVGQSEVVTSHSRTVDKLGRDDDGIVVNKEQATVLRVARDRMTDDELQSVPHLLRQLGPPVVLEQLRRGRRMNPHMVASLLANDDKTADGTSDKAPLPTAIELQSTQLLLRQQAELEDASFDINRYIASHPLDVDGLRYQHPVRLRSFSRHDRVFDGVSSALQNVTRCAARLDNQRASLFPEMQDDLAAVTFSHLPRARNAAWEAERSRHGPCIASHHCEFALYGESAPISSVIFTATTTNPSLPNPLLLPMPLPFTPFVL